MAQQNNQISRPLKLLPQDLSAEIAILGAVMLKPQIINEILEVLEVRDFYAENIAKFLK